MEALEGWRSRPCCWNPIDKGQAAATADDGGLWSVDGEEDEEEEEDDNATPPWLDTHPWFNDRFVAKLVIRLFVEDVSTDALPLSVPHSDIVGELEPWTT